LYLWGGSVWGQLGNNTDLTQAEVTQTVYQTNDWRYVNSAFGYSSFALKDDSSLWGWGQNIYGQLGIGNIINKSTPVQIVVGSETWRYVYSGNHTIAITTSGNLYCWGLNIDGQLASNDKINRSLPVAIPSSYLWDGGGAGNDFTIVLSTDGYLFSCGNNIYGQLGLNSQISYSSLIQIGSSSNWKFVTVDAVNNSAFAMKADGTVWSWGNNQFGNLGQNTTTDVSAPTQIGTESNYLQISAGSFTFFALKKDGTLWAVGQNSNGYLGDGTTIDRSSLVQIGSGTTWSKVAAGTYFTAARRFYWQNLYMGSQLREKFRQYSKLFFGFV